MTALASYACALAYSTGPLLQANDDTEEHLAYAQANAMLVRRAWCECATPAEEAYWRRADGRHGWMCCGCHGITQTG